MTKRCTKCLQIKPVSAFEIRSDTGKYRSQCMVCVNEKARYTYKVRPQREPIDNKVCPKCGGIVEMGLSYQAYCNGCKNEASAEYRVEHPTAQAEYYQQNKRVMQSSVMFGKYGIDLDDYDELLASQNGCCAICGGVSDVVDSRNGEIRRMHIDHDHLTGQVRGILCHPCNTTLGNMHDDPALLRKAAAYLEEKVR